jgi:serine/threonine-protein kinase
VRPDDLERLTSALATHYRFERQLGEGAFASVFIARDLRHERSVAVKVLNSDPDSELNEQRFLQEIRFLASLQHPNIIPVHDSGHIDNFLYYVMPYVRGETVRERIRRERVLPIADAVDISIEISDALGYAHGQGVIHRDIKPENILLSGSHAMLADFGIARVINASRGRHLTATGIGSPGTPAYMSPEQLLGETHVDGRTDIYSLGCVLFEMLTGSPPFEGPDAAAKRFIEPAPSARASRREISSELDHVVATALSVTPRNRFQAAADMCDALVTARRELRGSRRGRELIGRNSKSSHLRLAIATAQYSRWFGQWSTKKVVLAAGVGLIAISLVGAQAAGLFTHSKGATAAIDSRRIAVIDFEDQSEGHHLGHVATGLAISLAHELNGVNGLQIVSRNSLRSFREKPLDTLVEALRIGTLVEGTLQRSGDRLRVTIALIDAPSKTQLTSAAVERPMGELFLLEDDVAHEAASLLRRRLGVQVRLRELSTGTTSARARELVFRADKLRDDVSRESYSSDAAVALAAISALRASDSLLSAAEQADRRWLVPIINRGLVALDLAKRQGGVEQAEAFQRAIDQADRALERDSISADALEIRGTALYWQAAKLDLHDAEFRRRLARSEGDLRRALSVDASLASAWGALALVRVAQGQVAAATTAAETALKMDTYLKDAPIILYTIYAATLMNDDIRSAYKWCIRGSRDYPQEHGFIDCRLTLLAEDETRQPDVETAIRLVAKGDSVDPPSRAAAVGRPYTPINRRMMLAIVLARAGARDSSRAVARAAEIAARGSSELALYLKYDKAYLHLVLGERTEAIRLLSEYLAARPTLRGLVSKHPRWRSLRNEAAFQRLVA